MNKSVLLSIQPKWCELIASGKKTIEVRKSKPTVEMPFKCYIYETQDKQYEKSRVVFSNGRGFAHATGKVIGEFVCDCIEKEHVEFTACANIGRLYWCCMSLSELTAYIGKGDYAFYWHISDLKIYDKPKDLSEFTTPFCPYEVAKCKVGARLCKHYTFEDALGGECDYAHRVTRPPQSYMFVEEI